MAGLWGVPTIVASMLRELVVSTFLTSVVALAQDSTVVRVIDWESGLPVAYATVRISRTGPAQTGGWESETDTDGLVKPPTLIAVIFTGSRWREKAMFTRPPHFLAAES